jgi:hypothetical protein
MVMISLIKKISRFFIFLLWLFIANFSVPVYASVSKGIVIYNQAGCRGRYIVETSLGYAILEWFGGNDPSEGDVLIGEIHSFGFKNLYNITRRSKTRVWIEDYMIGKSRLEEKFFAKFCQ